jgi:hypothetical protein
MVNAVPTAISYNFYYQLYRPSPEFFFDTSCPFCVEVASDVLGWEDPE